MRLHPHSSKGLYFILAIFFFNFNPSISHSAEPAPVELSDIKVEEVYQDLEIFASSLTIIESYYVEEVLPHDLIYGSLKGMLQSLDPYSQFLEPKAHDDIKVETQGKFGGVGVEISIRDGVLTVVSPLDGTPAEKAGILAGDKVVRIDDKPTRDLALSDAVEKLRGEPGTDVKLSILREGQNQLIVVTVKRAIIKIQSIRRAGFLQAGIGYIRLSTFQQNTPQSFRKEIRSLEDKGIRGLIIDLRNNPGGLFPEALQVAEEIIPHELMIVSTKGRVPDQNKAFYSEGPVKPKTYPIVVIINQGTASASEIIAGALQDHRLAIVLGTKSFGKGSVQTVVPMRDGSALKLTTSRYFTPLGRQIHDHGVEPDVEVKYQPIQAKDLSQKEKAQNQVDDALDAEKGMGKLEKDAKAYLEKIKSTDNQVQRAMDLIRALNVLNQNEQLH